MRGDGELAQQREKVEREQARKMGKNRERRRRRRSEGRREGGGEECTMCEGRHQSLCEHQPIPR